MVHRQYAQSKNILDTSTGKGIMYTTGALFAPKSYDLRSITLDGIEIVPLLLLQQMIMIMDYRLVRRYKLLVLKLKDMMVHTL